MKILAIIGSYRGNRGYTSYLIDKLLAGASSAGASCEVIHLSSQNIKRCTGCFACQQEAHLLTCIYENKDDTKEIFEKIRAAIPGSHEKSQPAFGSVTTNDTHPDALPLFQKNSLRKNSAAALVDQPVF